MKLMTLLPLAALSSAFVIPDEVVMSNIARESPENQKFVFDKVPSKSQVVSEFKIRFSKLVDTSKDAVDDTADLAEDASQGTWEKAYETFFEVKDWADQAMANTEQAVEDLGHHGNHGHHCHKPNLTIYELVSKSKYFTKLAALINEYPDLVTILNGTVANYTLFAPIDSAFEKIPEHAPKPSKDELKQILMYHYSPEFYPAGKILVTHTIPTALKAPHIGDKPQRLSTNIGLRGLTLNFYSRVIGANLFATNGVIHGIDSLLVIPLKAAEVVELLPTEFSTLELGLAKTGLFKAINDTSNHIGGTLFAPNNFAFLKLGPRINAFLFSKYGQKYLKALLAYHIVANKTLYSDAFYDADLKEDAQGLGRIPKGYFHVDLPTILRGKSLSIDVARFGRFIEIKINGFSTVVIEDGIADDGVIQVVSNVLIPPKPVTDAATAGFWNGEELSVEELKERLDPYVEEEEVDYIEL